MDVPEALTDAALTRDGVLLVCQTCMCPCSAAEISHAPIRTQFLRCVGGVSEFETTAFCGVDHGHFRNRYGEASDLRWAGELGSLHQTPG